MNQAEWNSEQMVRIRNNVTNGRDTSAQDVEYLLEQVRPTESDKRDYAKEAEDDPNSWLNRLSRSEQ